VNVLRIHSGRHWENPFGKLRFTEVQEVSKVTSPREGVTAGTSNKKSLGHEDRDRGIDDRAAENVFGNELTGRIRTRQRLHPLLVSQWPVGSSSQYSR
jgi:hypothetical protein